MKKQFYIAPFSEIVAFSNEGFLCQSGNAKNLFLIGFLGMEDEDA